MMHRYSVGLAVGSPGYMSPEQARGESVTAQSDLYGLGVVLYEMLVGKPLYQADNSLAVMFKHLHDPIPKLPFEYAHFQPVLDKLLAKKIVDRYRNAGEFLRALNLIIPGDTGLQSEWNTGNNSLGVFGFTSGKLQRLLRVKPQRSTWLGILGAAILIAVVGYVFKSRNALNVITPESPKPIEQIPQLSREAEIAALLKQADAQLQEGLFSDETEQSIESAYRRVLKLDRGNTQALAGLEDMVKAYEQSAQRYLKAGLPQMSLEAVEKGLAIAPGRAELLKLRQEAEQQLAELKAKKIEQERQEAMRLQAEQLLINAQNAFREGLLEISLAHIEQGLLAVPQHPGLLALREQVKEWILERQRQEEAQQHREAEARRQAEEAERQKAEQMRRRREAEQFLVQALKLQRDGQYSDSLQQIEKGLMLVPDHLELIQLRDQVRISQSEEQKRQAEYAKREQEIKTLLQQAETHFKAGRLTEPEGNNAEQIYQRIIMQLDADNTQARAGLAKIAQDYLQQARRRYKDGALPDSLILIDKGLALVPNQTDMTRLREEVSQKIAEMQAQQQREQEQQAQAAQLLMQAQRNIQEGRLEDGLAFIERGLSVVPNHRELSVLREQVKVKIAQQQREAEAKQKAEAMERQVEEIERQKTEQLRKQAEAEQRQQEADRWLMQAVDSQHNGKYKDSLQQIDKGLALVPDHRELIQLREQILTQQAEEKKQQAEQKRNEEIKKLLDQAEAQFKAGRLTEPTGKNAEATYRQLLKLDTNNSQAQTGLERIAQDYLQQAQHKKAARDWQGSLKLIEKGLAVIPNQAGLVHLREEIRAQTAIEQQKLERQRQEEKQRREQQLE